MYEGTAQRRAHGLRRTADLVEAPEENLLHLLQVKGDLLQGCPGVVVEVSQ